MYLALRELQHHRFRSLLIGGIVALIAFMVFMLTGLTRGLARDNAALLMTTNATHFITTAEAQGVFTRSFLSPEDVTAVSSQKNAGQVTPIAQNFVSLGNGEKQLSAVLLGIEPGSFMAPAVTEGQKLTAEASGAVVDATLRTKGGVELGDTLTLKPGGETVKVIGFTEGARLNHQAVVFVTMKRWQALNPRNRGTVNALALRGDVPTLPDDLTATTTAATLQVLPGYKEEQGSLTMIQVFLVVVAAFVMAVFFYVITLQKTPQFGLLKAIGASTRTLATSLVAQMLLLSLLAVIVAAVITLGMVQVLPSGMPFYLTNLNLLTAGALLIGVAALSSLLSLRSIARVDPLIAIGTTT